ncbi:MAG: hypothetical protein HIU85_09470 [Proteobacteria bacterium]|nr:hypothetical protein [Pseudomonadota bacterium]
MTDSAPSPSPLAGFRGPVACRRAGDALILSGCAADCADENLILTFTSPKPADVPESVNAAVVTVIDGQHYRIASGPRDWVVAAKSVHVHRDIRGAFYRAIPARPAPLMKRVFWRIVMALAGNPAGKRLLLSMRGN